MWRCLRPLLKRRREKVAPVDAEPAATNKEVHLNVNVNVNVNVETPREGGKTEILWPEPSPASQAETTPRCSTPRRSTSRRSKSRRSKSWRSKSRRSKSRQKASYEEAVRHSTQKANAADLVLAECWPVVLSKLNKYTSQLGGLVPTRNSHGRTEVSRRRIALAASARDAQRLLDALDAADRCLSVPSSLRVACDSLVFAAQVVQCWNHINAAVSRADSADLVLWLEQAEWLGLDVKPEKNLVEPRSCRDSRDCSTPPVRRAAKIPPRCQSPSPSVDQHSDQSTTVRSERNSDRNTTPNTTPRAHVPADGFLGSYRRMHSEPLGRPQRPQSAQGPKSAFPRRASKDRPPRPQSARPPAPPPSPPPQETPPPPPHPPATSSTARSGTAEIGSKWNSGSSTQHRPASAGRSTGPSDADWMPPPQPNATPPRGHRVRSESSTPPRPSSAPPRRVSTANATVTGASFRSPRWSENTDGDTADCVFDFYSRASGHADRAAQRPRTWRIPSENPKAGAPTSAASSSEPPRAAPNYRSSSLSDSSSADGNSPCDTPRENPAAEAQKPVGSSAPRQYTVREQHLQALDLDISANATERELKIAYRQAALRYHPDRQHNSADREGAAEHFKAARAAYDYFLAPAQRGSFSE